MGGSAIREDWTKVLRRGEDAIRERLAKSTPSSSADANAESGPASESVAAVTAAQLPAAAGSPQTQPSPNAVSEPQAPQAPPVTPVPGQADSEPPPLPHLFAQLSTGDRIVQPLLYRDRTVLIAVCLVMFLTASTGLSQIPWPGDTTGRAASQRPPKDPIGQNEQSISVDLVSEPVAGAKPQPAAAGEPTPIAPPAPAEVQPNQQTQSEPKPEPEKKPEQEAKPDLKPLTVDDFDVSMNDVVQAIDQAQAERKRQKAKPPTAQASQVQGSGARGRTTPFSKAVYSALAARWPPAVALVPGTAFVVFQIERDGTVKHIRFLTRSGSTLFDQQVVDAIKSSRIPAPPANVEPGELIVQIEYTLSAPKN